MDRRPEPLISRNFATFLAALTGLILATPFADRKDWLGWVTSVVVVLAVGTMLWLIVRRVIDEWTNID